MYIKFFCRVHIPCELVHPALKELQYLVVHFCGFLKQNAKSWIKQLFSYFFQFEPIPAVCEARRILFRFCLCGSSPYVWFLMSTISQLNSYKTRTSINHNNILLTKGFPEMMLALRTYASQTKTYWSNKQAA